MKRTLALILLFTSSTFLRASTDSIEAILAVGSEGKGNSEAAQAWSKITASADIASLMMVFDAMDGWGVGLQTNQKFSLFSKVVQIILDHQDTIPDRQISPKGSK